MRCSHTPRLAHIDDARFDEDNLLPAGGALPVMDLARRAGLGELARRHVKVPADKGANPDAKVMAVVAGMVMGADSIDDLAQVRAGAMGKAAGFTHAPSTLGQFPRRFTFGHVRQLDAVASRLTLALAGTTGLFGDVGRTGPVMVDIDDSVVEVHGHAKQGAGRGHTGKKGLNMLLATVTGRGCVPPWSRPGSARGPRPRRGAPPA
jgi:hypothetical protein